MDLPLALLSNCQTSSCCKTNNYDGSNKSKEHCTGPQIFDKLRILLRLTKRNAFLISNWIGMFRCLYHFNFLKLILLECTKLSTLVQTGQLLQKLLLLLYMRRQKTPRAISLTQDFVFFNDVNEALQKNRVTQLESWPLLLKFTNLGTNGSARLH